MIRLLAATAAAALCCVTAAADTMPDSHAPIGVMGDHVHNKQEVMFSYRYMHMSMEGNIDDGSSVSPDFIVENVPNRFANPPMMPPTLRVVPTKMTMNMHMFGVMYAPIDRVTLMAMVNLVDKEMDHVTYQGPTGTTTLGTFTTRTSGLGDSRLAALVRLPSSAGHRWHATIGVSVPTGATDESDEILTPMNTRPSPRLPYQMQLGSGTWDLVGGLTVARVSASAWGWGAQWHSVVRTGDNDEGYSLGDEHRLTAWASYRVGPALSLSGRLSAFDRSNIDGIDPMIMAPVQTADPDRQAATRVDVGIGVNLLLPGDRHRLAFEVLAPVDQHVDGPQLETDLQLMLGWQFSL